MTSVIVALVAIGLVLTYVELHSSNSSTNTALPNFPTTTVPLTTTTTVPTEIYIPPTTSTTTTVPTTSPTTVVTPVKATPTTTTTGPVGPCTPQDLLITTTTDSQSYATGTSVTVSSQIKDTVACDFKPVATGPYSCPTSVVIVNSQGNQVWPWSGQGEQCSVPTSGLMEPGSTQSISAVWNQQVPASSGSGGQQTPAGSYKAVGTWAWSSGGNTSPYQIAANSRSFTIS